MSTKLTVNTEIEIHKDRHCKRNRKRVKERSKGMAETTEENEACQDKFQETELQEKVECTDGDQFSRSVS